ncbi:MAG: SUMF1/EgtB/PvdO family nonheme iron enzyme [Chitinophagales bacterium]
MKTYTLLFLLPLLAAAPGKDDPFTPLNEALSISRYEVSNFEYRQFLDDIKTSDPDLYRFCMYDSTAWQNRFGYAYMEPMTTHYHSHPAYDQYPVVNITPAAATAYCEWLTDKIGKEQYRFRLPTEKEWMEASAAHTETGLPYAQADLIDHKKKKDVPLANVKVIKDGESNFMSDDAFLTAPVESFQPNDIGLFNMSGNVAEMTLDGYLKGGSWYDPAEECRVSKRQLYQTPDPRVGFRVIREKRSE